MRTCIKMIPVLTVAIAALTLGTLRAQQLEKIDETSLRALMQSYKGKTVMVNLWATWCKPCVEEFPELLKAQNEMKDDGVELVLISLDFGEGAEMKTTDFLKKQEVDFRTYINAFSKDEELINFFDKQWEGAIPATFVYDKEGKLSSALIGKRKYEDFVAAINKAN
ncbi:MAG: TlpA family protein disulfide reductase [Ignavibacteria bacterium]|nr:TlpA family protein disulfide reductase [Ignavibacteria bacterium]